jgi:hypothetical protein
VRALRPASLSAPSALAVPSLAPASIAALVSALVLVSVLASMTGLGPAHAASAHTIVETIARLHRECSWPLLARSLLMVVVVVPACPERLA